MPIVLTTNEKILSGHAWKDRIGEQYHFPNQYRNMIQPGEQFVYYRGVHRQDGSRGSMGYLGVGNVGEVWLDTDTEDEPAGRRNWYCAIEDYIPFTEPVLAKEGDETIEDVSQPNHWRRAVRRISDQQLDTIAQKAHVAHLLAQARRQRDELVEYAANVAVPILGHVAKARAKRPDSNLDASSRRHSRKSKIVGDAAERIVFEYLKANVDGIRQLKWLANEGKTPGWDIEYQDKFGRKIRVEVKGSESWQITSLEMTANEWRAAETYRSDFQLALVGGCLSDQPVIEFIIDPANGLGSGEIHLRPVRFELTWPAL